MHHSLTCQDDVRLRSRQPRQWAQAQRLLRVPRLVDEDVGEVVLGHAVRVQLQEMTRGKWFWSTPFDTTEKDNTEY